MTGHRASEQGIPAFGCHDDLIHLQVCIQLVASLLRFLLFRLSPSVDPRFPSHTLLDPCSMLQGRL